MAGCLFVGCVRQHCLYSCFELSDLRGTLIGRIMRFEAESQICQIDPEAQFFECVLVHIGRIGGNARRL